PRMYGRSIRGTNRTDTSRRRMPGSMVRPPTVAGLHGQEATHPELVRMRRRRAAHDDPAVLLQGHRGEAADEALERVRGPHDAARPEREVELAARPVPGDHDPLRVRRRRRHDDL